MSSRLYLILTTTALLSTAAASVFSGASAYAADLGSLNRLTSLGTPMAPPPAPPPEAEMVTPLYPTYSARPAPLVATTVLAPPGSRVQVQTPVRPAMVPPRVVLAPPSPVPVVVEAVPQPMMAARYPRHPHLIPRPTTRLSATTPALWVARSGRTVQSVLEDWASLVGWKVTWKPDYQYTVVSGAEFSNATFEDAASTLIAAYANASPPLHLDIYEDNSTLVVRSPADVDLN